MKSCTKYTVKQWQRDWWVRGILFHKIAIIKHVLVLSFYLLSFFILSFNIKFFVCLSLTFLLYLLFYFHFYILLLNNHLIDFTIRLILDRYFVTKFFLFLKLRLFPLILIICNGDLILLIYRLWLFYNYLLIRNQIWSY